MSAEVGHRQFYDFETHSIDIKKSSCSKSEEHQDDKKDLFEYVNENIIGSNGIFSSPFGRQKITYCDYIASGRSLKFIEDYIINQVLPQYGSTHTTTSVTSLQTSLFRHEARDLIRNATRASEHDRIIFTGSGTTGAINKLINGLKFDVPPVVFVDFTAHHSSLLPWREIGALVMRVRETMDGNLDLNHLKLLLKHYQSSNRQMIGCFSAASNVTGLILDEIEITILLHKFGALAFWDYATAAPYLEVLMNPVHTDESSALAYKDALFFSLHKFIGGVQTPGVLIAKKALFKNPVPLECGGGTVFFVSRENHRFLKDVEEREEGGTPPIVETIRGGMVMQLKMSLTPQIITEKCFFLSKKIRDLVLSVPELVALGNILDHHRLPILSFVVKHLPSSKYLHHNFVSAILNDVYGIQSRGGCACAGPYAQDLLGIDEHLAQRYEKLLLEDSNLDRSHLRRKNEYSNHEILRPGFVRVNLPYSAPLEQIEFILLAIKRICEDGWKLLPQYVFNPETGEWKHHTNLVFKNRQWLQNISYSKGFFEANLKEIPSEIPSYEQITKGAETVFREAEKVSKRMNVPDQSLLFQGEAKELCWFLHSSEAKHFLNQDSNKPEIAAIPFTPLTYPISEEILKNRLDYVWSKREAIERNINFSSLQLKSVELNGNLATLDSEVFENHNTTQELFNASFESTIKTLSNNLREINCVQENINREERCTSVRSLCENGSCLVRREESLNTEMKSSISRPSSNIRLSLWFSPPKTIFNPTVEALENFHMIQPNDKVLICLSGGKDSLSLLHTIHQYQFYSKSKGCHFDIGAVTVDPQTSSYDPRPLIPYLNALGIPYYYEEQGILEQARKMESLNSICSFCSRMKRGRIYSAARREGFNVLALGQHLDDLAESFLMSLFHNGRLRTMKASYTVKEGDLRVIRPFVYVREKELRKFAESRRLPVIPENCPACFESPKERHRVKQVLAQQEVLFPHLFWSLKRALYPLLSIDKTGLENELFGKRAAELEDE